MMPPVFPHALFLTLTTSLLLPAGSAEAADRVEMLSPVLQLQSEKANDQDDMCVWVHPADPALSTIITADKEAGQLFVYDLQGQVLQTIAVPEPGNIDLRDNATFNGQPTSVVAVNQRDGRLQLRVFRMDLNSRRLDCIDNGKIATAANYGGCLYHSRQTGKLYFISTTKESGIQQYELSEDEDGKMGGKLVRSWKLGKSEGAVADDENGILYIGEEEHGVWMLDAEPHGDVPGELVIKIGDSGLQGDIEGLALLNTDQHRLLVLSDQGASRFLMLDRDTDHKVAGAFSCEGADSTDGIEIITQPLGPDFPHGLFSCHTDINGRPTLVARLDAILSMLDQTDE